MIVLPDLLLKLISYALIVELLNILMLIVKLEKVWKEIKLKWQVKGSTSNHKGPSQRVPNQLRKFINTGLRKEARNMPQRKGKT